MVKKIVWTKTAQKQFDDIVDYIETEWSEKIAAKFTNRVNDFFGLLQLYPEVGSIEVKKKRIKGFLLTKQVRLFYRIKGQNIILLSFFDTRLSHSKKLRRYK